MRELTTVKIEKISIVGVPANRKTWLLKKSEDGDEVAVAVAKFLGVEVSVEKAERAEIVAALSELEVYRETMPDSMLDAVSTLARVCAQGVAVEVEKEEEEVVDPNDDFPSIHIPTAEQIVEEEEELEKEEEPDDEDNYDPTLIKLNRIEKKLDRLEEPAPENPWPSLDKLLPGFQPMVKAKAKVKVDSNKKVVPKRTQLSLGEADDEELKKNVKVDEVEDDYPSISDAFFEPR